MTNLSPETRNTDKGLYKRLRNLPVFRSKLFPKWVKEKHPEKECHHLLGSMTGIKLNDFLILPITRAEHLEAEKNKSDFAIDNLHLSLKLLFEYVADLESKQ